jgi:uncharacterized protein (DUF2147 family)
VFRLSLLAVLLGFALVSAAYADDGSTPTGRWITAQHNAVIQIAPCGRDLCGQIVGLAPANPAEGMPVDWRGHPQCGQTIIQTAPVADASGNMVWQGSVLDPRNGNVYKAQLSLDADRHLELHGYLGLPIFGQTQTWTPFSGRTLADCRLATATSQGNG